MLIFKQKCFTLFPPFSFGRLCDFLLECETDPDTRIKGKPFTNEFVPKIMEFWFLGS